jgi:hypothetical protein
VKVYDGWTDRRQTPSDGKCSHGFSPGELKRVHSTCNVLVVFSQTLFHSVIINRLIDFWCFNATFSNISAISWRPVLVMEEAGVLGENHRPWASNW